MQQYYVGMDLHSNNTFIVILDAQGKKVWKGKLPNQLELIIKSLASFQEGVVGVVVESTYNWYWLVDGLMSHG